MKKFLTRGRTAVLAGVVALAAIIGVGIVAPAQAYVTTNDQLIHADLVRNTAQGALTASNGSYTNLTASSVQNRWLLDEYGGFAFSSTGVTVPVDGVYHLSWSTILNAGGSGIGGFYIDGNTPNGGTLLGIGPIVNLAAAVGNGSADVWLAAGQSVDFWVYGSGSAITLQAAPATRVSITLLQEDLPPE